MKISIMFFIVLTFLVASFLFGCGDDDTVSSLNPTATPGGQTTAAPQPTAFPTVNVTVEEFYTNTTADLYSIWFVDDSVGYAAGADLTVIKTTDGGQTWQDASPTIEEVNNWEKSNGDLSTGQEKQTDLDNIYGVAFSNQNFGMIAGEHELIMYTTDGGDTWQWSQRVDEFTGRSGTDITFEWMEWYLLGDTDYTGLFTTFNYDPTGSAFCTSTGEEWIRGEEVPPEVKYNDSASYGRQLWRVGSQGTIERSSNHGQSWEKSNIFNDPSVEFNSVYIQVVKGFSPFYPNLEQPQAIIAGTGGSLLYSKDLAGDANWEQLKIPGMCDRKFVNAYITEKGRIIVEINDEKGKCIMGSDSMGTTWKQLYRGDEGVIIHHDFLYYEKEQPSLYGVGDNGAAVKISPLDW